MLTKYTFSARKASPFTNNDAQVIGNCLVKLFPDGIPTPEGILEHAKKPKSPLHKYFDWDDHSAAEKWRISQARKMIQSVCVTIINDDDDEIKTRAYENVVVDGKRHYQDIDTIQKSKTLVDSVLSDALKQLEYWKIKYEKFRSLKDLVSDIGDVIEKYQKELEQTAKKKTSTINRKVKNESKKDSIKNKPKTKTKSSKKIKTKIKRVGR